MSANRHLPHLYILPEDDANRQIATGFQLEIGIRRVQVLSEVRGWTHVCEVFASTHVAEMRKWSERSMVLLVDFDDDGKRLEKVRKDIPADLASRVFVIGSKTDPEDLKRALRLTYEAIGRALAADCRSGAQTVWSHELLRHNGEQVAKLLAAGCCSLV